MDHKNPLGGDTLRHADSEFFSYVRLTRMLETGTMQAIKKNNFLFHERKGGP